MKKQIRGQCSRYGYEIVRLISAQKCWTCRYYSVKAHYLAKPLLVLRPTPASSLLVQVLLTHFPVRAIGQHYAQRIQTLVQYQSRVYFGHSELIKRANSASAKKWLSLRAALLSGGNCSALLHHNQQINRWMATAAGLPANRSTYCAVGHDTKLRWWAPKSAANQAYQTDLGSPQAR